MPAGKEFADIVFVPHRGKNKPAIIVELKWNKTVEGTIGQIKERKYVEALKEYQEDMLLVAVNYDKKTKRHACVIKKIK